MTKAYNLIIRWVCNTNCSFCNFYETKVPVDSYTHFIELKNEIDQVVIESYSYIYIWFYWYEPTTFEFFQDILKYISSKWISVHLNTNAVKFSDRDFCLQSSPYIESVDITLYSSNDIEHFLYTQKKQSYLLKHRAISYLMEFEVRVNLRILVLNHNIHHIYDMILQTESYWDNKNFRKRISITFPSTEMDALRIKILIPRYGLFIDTINKLYQSTKKKSYNNIVINIDTDLPMCITKFLRIWGNFTYTYQKNSLSAEYKYIDTCNDCKFRERGSCYGINKKYLEVFWWEEINRDDLYILSDNILPYKRMYSVLQKAKNFYE